jgi:hypothetical protein
MMARSSSRHHSVPARLDARAMSFLEHRVHIEALGPGPPGLFRDPHPAPESVDRGGHGFGYPRCLSPELFEVSEPERLGLPPRFTEKGGVPSPQTEYVTTNAL